MVAVGEGPFFLRRPAVSLVKRAQPEDLLAISNYFDLFRDKFKELFFLALCQNSNVRLNVVAACHQPKIESYSEDAGSSEK
jgi:hypothetical protein